MMVYAITACFTARTADISLNLGFVRVFVCVFVWWLCIHSLWLHSPLDRECARNGKRSVRRLWVMNSMCRIGIEAYEMNVEKRTAHDFIAHLFWDRIAVVVFGLRAERRARVSFVRSRGLQSMHLVYIWRKVSICLFHSVFNFPHDDVVCLRLVCFTLRSPSINKIFLGIRIPTESTRSEALQFKMQSNQNWTERRRT